jgi:hypothetical protein
MAHRIDYCLQLLEHANTRIIDILRNSSEKRIVYHP